MSVKEKTKKDQGQSLSKSDYHEIILYNDDINTFDHVIDILIKVCDHSATQAEQCAFCLLYTSPSPRDRTRSRMPSSA